MQSWQKRLFQAFVLWYENRENCCLHSTALFNERYAAILKIMDVLKMKIGPQCKQYADSYDAERIKVSGPLKKHAQLA